MGTSVLRQFIKGGVRAEIAQLLKYTPLFQPFTILDLYLQHMESLTEIVGRQAIYAPTSPIIEQVDQIVASAHTVNRIKNGDVGSKISSATNSRYLANTFNFHNVVLSKKYPKLVRV